jgi:hypothetical protein
LVALPAVVILVALPAVVILVALPAVVILVALPAVALAAVVVLFDGNGSDVVVFSILTVFVLGTQTNIIMIRLNITIARKYRRSSCLVCALI